MTPTFQGEVQFRRYSDTSTQGQQVVFAVQDREALESFIGMEGKRFMAVLVQIGDDEQAVPPTPERLKGGEWAKLAGMWCDDPEFWRWANSSTINGVFWHINNSSDAAGMVRELCSIDTRAKLDHSKSAWERFNVLIRGPYMKWMQARRSA